ncbi:phosphotransferase family protein [Streptomyces sp. NPDC059452]|uniref:phosphotransferase family protein n=1 Tax=Streptomyces sp. NPDC059452 TaxID=3346835 RepID=UPI0036B2372A
MEFEERSPLLVKWPDDDAELNNNYESVALKMLRELEVPDSFRGSVPSVVGSYDDGKMLALEVLDPATSLRDLLSLSGRLPHVVTSELATCLAILHSADATHIRARYPEWDLMLPVPTSCHLSLEEYSWGCGLDFEAYLKVMQRLEPAFVDFHKAWTHQSLIHFDLRDDNILFRLGETTDCRIIDWELAGFGDPLYDVGYVVAYLLLPMIRAQAAGSGSRSATVSSRDNSMDLICAYTAEAALEPENKNRIIAYAGLALVVHASMRLQQLGALGKIGHLCLLIGERLICKPEKSGLT